MPGILHGDIQKQTDELSEEDRNGLLAYLIDSLPHWPECAVDEELDQRDAEMDSGAVTPITHSEFISQVGRGR